MLDERWIRALHVETMREEELHAEREHHVFFQIEGDTARGSCRGRFRRIWPAGPVAVALPHVLGRRFASSSAMGVPRGDRTPGPGSTCPLLLVCRADLDVEGTMLGFRFPDYVEGLEVSGYHLHFISADRRRGGHVLGSSSNGLRAQLDPSSELHVELPPAVTPTPTSPPRPTRQSRQSSATPDAF